MLKSDLLIIIYYLKIKLFVQLGIIDLFYLTGMFGTFEFVVLSRNISIIQVHCSRMKVYNITPKLCPTLVMTLPLLSDLATVQLLLSTSVLFKIFKNMLEKMVLISK